MSEIKGQLVGILIVLAIGTAVGGILLGAFESQATSIASQVTGETISARSEVREVVAPSGNVYSY